MAIVGEPPFEVLPSMRLLRRLVPRHFVPDGKGGQRLSSAAFKTQKLSVDCEDFREHLGETWEASLVDYPDEGLVRFLAAIVIDKGQQVTHDPVTADPTTGTKENRSHCLVIGRISDGTIRDILRSSTFLAYPSGVS